MTYFLKIFLYTAILSTVFANVGSCKDEYYIVNGGFAVSGDADNITQRFYLHIRFKRPLDKALANADSDIKNIEDLVREEFKYLKIHTWSEDNLYTERARENIVKTRSMTFANANSQPEVLIKEYPLYTHPPAKKAEKKIYRKLIDLQRITISKNKTSRKNPSYTIKFEFLNNYSASINTANNHYLRVTLDNKFTADFNNKSKTVSKSNEKSSCPSVFK